MTNEERRAALARARVKALDWADKAEEYASVGHADHAVKLAVMWSAVADALKVGDLVADSVPYSHERV